MYFSLVWLPEKNSHSFILFQCVVNTINIVYAVVTT
jgi:hypothetical protein